MAFDNVIEAFIKDYVNDLLEHNAALFAGAGMLLHFPRRRHLEAASFKSGNRPY